MEHIVNFNSGHDCMRFECKHDDKNCIPGGNGSHGVHGLDIEFIVKGYEGVVRFLLFTGWLPKYTKTEGVESCWQNTTDSLFPVPAQIGFFSILTQHSGTYHNDKPHDAMYSLVNGGDQALWAYLDAFYDHVFRDGKRPERFEYPKPVRS
jgi:hypothetical protein